MFYSFVGATAAGPVSTAVTRGNDDMVNLAIILFVASFFWFLFSLLRPVKDPSEERHRELDAMDQEELISRRNSLLFQIKTLEAPVTPGATAERRNRSAFIDLDTDSNAIERNTFTGPGSDEAGWKCPGDVIQGNDGHGVDILGDDGLGSDKLDDI